MSRAIITESKLTAIADAIRAKTGGTADLTVDEMASEISEINTAVVQSGAVTQMPSGGYIYRIQDYKQLLTGENTSSNLTINMSNVQSSLRVIHRFKKKENQRAWMILYCNRNSNGNNGILLGFNDTAEQKIYVSGGTNSYVYLNTIFDNSKWYYVVTNYDVTTQTLHAFVYSDDGELLEHKTKENQTTATNLGDQREANYFGSSIDTYQFTGYRDLDATLFEIDGVAVWGSTNSKTANMGIIEQGGNNQ